MLPVPEPVTTIHGVRADAVPADLLTGTTPFVLKDFAAAWPLVAAGIRSPRDAIACLRNFDGGKTVGAFIGDPDARGRYAYNAAAKGLNFARRLLPLADVLDRIEAQLDDDAPTPVYVGSTTIDASLPGLRAANDVRFPENMAAPLASIWLGNPSIVPTHFDSPANLACSVVGKRRFTLFPPEQVSNLYPGPLDPTPGGQPTSMVDLAAPDFEHYPRYREALAAAQIAELEAGDAVFIPHLWWHQVDATARFNVLFNYWWSSTPSIAGSPMDALYHALMTLRDRPNDEKQAWRHLFDYYVFGDAAVPGAHLSPEARGLLAPLDDTRARQLRAYLLDRLQR